MAKVHDVISSEKKFYKIAVANKVKVLNRSFNTHKNCKESNTTELWEEKCLCGCFCVTVAAVHLTCSFTIT